MKREGVRRNFSARKRMRQAAPRSFGRTVKLGETVGFPRFRGQAATETLVMFGFIAAFSIPIILLLYGALGTQSDELAVSQARITTRALADAANEIYAQGTPANRVMLVHYPEGVKNITVKSSPNSREAGEIIFTLQTAKGDVDVVATTFFPDVRDGARRLDRERRSAGALTIGGGLHVVNISAVNISDDRIGVEISYASE